MIEVVTHPGRPSPGEVRGRGGRQGDGGGVREGVGAQQADVHRHVGPHARLRPHAVAHTELQLVPTTNISKSDKEKLRV